MSDLLAGPIAPHNTAVVDRPWDGPANEARLSNDAGAATYRRAYAWVDPDGDADTKAAYRFPHHEVSGDGAPGPANLSGVRNALARLPQSNVPASDHDGVKAHLQRHLDAQESSSSATPARPAGERAYPQIIRAISETPWAMLPSAFAALREVVSLRLEGIVLSAEEITERVSAGPGSREVSHQGAIAVLPIYGAIFPRANLMSEFSGGTSLDSFGRALDAAVADPEVSTILLDVNSPGGSVDLMPETVAKLREARKRKPIVAVANTMAASAAYWLASQADEIVVSPSARVGSVGVIAAHDDESAMWESEGIKTTLIHAGKYKTEANPFEPLTDEARATIQTLVDEVYGWFVSDVAKGRGVGRKAVEAGFGQGRLVGAQAAVDAGMADRVGTLEGTIARLGAGRGRAKLAAVAEDEGSDLSPQDEARQLAALSAAGVNLAALEAEVQYQKARRRRGPKTGG